MGVGTEGGGLGVSARDNLADSPQRPSVLPIIERYGGKRGQQALALAAAVQLTAPAVKWVQEKRKREDFTIVVAGTDSVYPELHEWVLARIPAQERKALILDTSREEPHVQLRYDGTRVQQVVIDGHKIEVEVQREDLPGGRERLPENWRRLMEKVSFKATTPAGRDAVVRMIEGLADTRYAEAGPPPLLMPSRWGGEWINRSDLPPRTLESVVLKAGQLERLVADLGNFLDAESDYGRLCQSWHRAYLFHGQPGTGKTSVARALAHHFGLRVYYLPLGDMETDGNLMSLISSVNPRSVLLIEDIDVYHAATERSEEEGRPSLAAMLNALDGVWTPHGLVTVMTTNNREALDGALIRPGRVDVSEEFTALDSEQAQRLAAFCGMPASSAAPFVGQSPAVLMEAARQSHQTGGTR